MNQTIINIWLLCFFYSTACFSQSTTIESIIQEIEENSDFTVNHNVDVLRRINSSYSFNEDYSIDNIKKYFQTTPLDIRVENKIILVLPLKMTRRKLCTTIKSKDYETTLPYATLLTSDGQGFITNDNGHIEDSITVYKGQTCTINYVGKKEIILPVERLLDCNPIYMFDANLFSESILIKSYMLRGIDEGIDYNGVLINKKHEQNNHLLRQDEIFSTIQLLPGINSPDDSPTNLNIRGSSSDQNLLLWEGVPIYGKGYLFGMISAVNPLQIDQINVYKSNHGAQYDNRIGGIVDMSLSDEIPNKEEYILGVNLTEANVSLKLPIVKDKLGLSLAYRKSLFGVFDGESPTYISYLNKVFNAELLEDNEDNEDGEESEEAEPSIDFQDLNIKIIGKLSDKLTIQSSLLSSKGTSEYLSVFSERSIEGKDILTTSNTALSNKITLQYDQENQLQLWHRHATLNNESKNIFSQNDTLSILEKEEGNSIQDDQIEINYSYSKGTSHFIAGYVLDYKSTTIKIEEVSNNNIETESEIPAFSTVHHTYAQFSHQTRTQTFELGNRFSYSRHNKNFYSSPSVSFRQQLMAGFFFKLSGGFYNQFIHQVYQPVARDLLVENSIWTLSTDEGDPVLSSRKVSSGFIFRKFGWLVDIEGYYHRASGLTAENPNVRNVLFTEEDNKIFTQGIDVFINKQILGFNTSLYYTLSKNEVSLADIFDDDTELFPANNDQRHLFRITTLYDIGDTELGLSYAFKSGLPFSNQAMVVDNDDDSFSIFYEGFNSSRLSSYKRLDLSLKQKLTFNSFRVEFGFSILNVFNWENIGNRKSVVITPNQNGESAELIEINKSLLPRTLTLQARISF